MSDSHEKPLHVETDIVSTASRHVGILMYIVKAKGKQWSRSCLTTQPILQLLKISHYSHVNTSASQDSKKKGNSKAVSNNVNTMLRVVKFCSMVWNIKLNHVHSSIPNLIS